MSFSSAINLLDDKLKRENIENYKEVKSYFDKLKEGKVSPDRSRKLVEFLKSIKKNDLIEYRETIKKNSFIIGDVKKSISKFDLINTIRRDLKDIKDISVFEESKKKIFLDEELVLKRERELAQQRELIKTMNERQTLRNMRHINESKNIIHYKANISNNIENIFEGNEVVALNNQFNYIVENIKRILKDVSMFVMVKATVGVLVDSAEKDINGKAKKFILYTTVKDSNYFEDVGFNSPHDKVLSIGELNFPSLEIVDSGIVKLSILPVLKQQYDFKDFVKSLIAYSPQAPNQSYHRLTATSTRPVDKECLYQSYHYLFVDNAKIISKNISKIKEDLLKESDEIKEYTKTGSVYKFLEVMSKRHNENMYVEFFNPVGRVVGFSVDPNGDVKEYTDENELCDKKVFLYDSNHVAPRKQNVINKNHIKSKNKVRKGFTISPSYITDKNWVEKMKRISKDEVIGFDFETFNDNENVATPYCLCLSNGVTFYGENTVMEFCDYLDSIITVRDLTKTVDNKKKRNKILMYGFNNSNFDNLFIFKELIRRNPRMKYTIANTSVKYMKYHNVYIIDLALYYSGSLERVAESFKLPITKGVFPYSFMSRDRLNYEGVIPDVKYWNSKDDMNKYINEKKTNMINIKDYTIEYCLKDVELVKQIALKHLENSIGSIKVKDVNGVEVERKFDVRTSPTAAGASLKLFNQVFQNEKLFGVPEKIQKVERAAYKGGRTEVFKKDYMKGEDNNDYLFYYDINASYPFAMTYTLPKTFVIDSEVDVEIDTTEKLNEYIVPYYIYKAGTKYNGNDPYFIPNLLQRSEKGDIIGVKNIDEGYFWGCELIEAFKNNCTFKIKHIYVYEGGKIFEDFANHFYDERLLNKKTNPAKAEFNKLSMNSLYGKTGQSANSHTKLCSNKYEIDQIMKNTDNMIIDFEDIEDFVMIKYSSITDGVENIGNLARLASYISAQARTNLAEIMRVIGHEHIYYCDTDSIFTSKEPPQEYLDQNKLGKWKKEMVKTPDKSEIPANITHAIFLAPKSYMYKIEHEGVTKAVCMKAKGHKNCDVEEDFYKKVLDGKNEEITNKAMFFRSLTEIVIKAQSRTLRSVYNKRVWHNNKKSEAFNNITEWMNNKLNN
jgi:hypothetical protein